MMKSVMAVCFWICLLCILAGAVISLLMVWNLVAGDWLYQVGLTIGVVFIAAGLTIAVGRTYLGQDPKV